MQVSVAMTTYNGEKFVRDQIKSILSQTRRPDQLVICDDGSTDGTASIIKDFTDEYPELIDYYENQENLGVTKNFEKAITHSHGDVIMISDQDDVWKENKIASQLKQYNESEKGLICHNSTLVSPDLTPITDLWSSNKYQHGLARSSKDAFEQLVYKYNFVQGATMLFESELKDWILPIPDTWQYDYYIAIISSLVSGIYDIDEELLLYRQHDAQDLGAPDMSFISNMFYSIQNFDYRHMKNMVDAWETLIQKVSEFEEEEITVQKSWVIGQISERLEYDKNRLQARNPNLSYINRCRGVYSNYKKGYYSKFGTYGVLSACRDLTSLFL
jgi:glycosyltransferase involved in cell wall biosynthesis